MVGYNLPDQPTPFVGRVKEASEVVSRLTHPTCRLLTLFGPGGIGKTRLAVEIAQAHLSEEDLRQFPDGICFVPLQPVSSPDQVVTAMIEALGISFFADRNPKEHLLYYLQGLSMLLLLDNCEHLLSDFSLVSELLAFAPGIKLLATSRERLRLHEEWIYELGGLGFPEGVHADESMKDYSAVQLFVQQARRTYTDFDPNGSQRAGMLRICQIVSGMPLALEMAATWVRALSCDEIADELVGGLDILETDNRNALQRHRNMRVVLAHSWEQLTEAEQKTLKRLSVFRGGFTREAAGVVAGANRRMLSALVDKSWLQWNMETQRFHMHELLRQFSAENLDAVETDDTRLAHSRYIADFMQARERDIKFRRQNEALAEIAQEFANVREAWTWAMSNRDADVLYRMSEALNFFGDMKARFLECEAMFRAASEVFAQPEGPQERLTYNRLRCRRLRMIITGAINHLFDREKWLEELTVIVAENRLLNNPAELAGSIFMVAMVVRALEGPYDKKALPYFEESHRIFQSLNDSFYVADILIFISFYHDKETSIALRHQTVEILRRIGDENGLAWSLLHLSHQMFRLRDFALSDRYGDEALAIQQRRNDIKGLWASRILAGEHAFNRGDFEQALLLAGEGYQQALKMNLANFKKNALGRLGLLHAIKGQDSQQARQCCVECLGYSISNAFALNSPDFEAALGLVIVAYYEQDPISMQANYQRMIASMWKNWNDSIRVSSLAPGAVLILDQQGNFELAVEMTARVIYMIQQPDQPITLWLEKWELLNRLREKWQHELGINAYEAAWKRGEKRDVSDLNKVLLNDLVPSADRAGSGLQSLEAMIEPLTGRELEVLRLVAEGLANRAIAERLVLSVGTVKWYVSEIITKLDSSSRTQAVARARELGLLS